jgi:outer membrane lipoprotein-sorting protein
LLPGSSSKDFKQAKVYPTADNTLEKVIVTGNDSNNIIFHFSNFRGNQNFDKEKFSFQIPKM